jgi:hypothetical protein
VKAIDDIRRYLSAHAGTHSADLLVRLVHSLSKEETLALRELYALDWDAFELAIELLRDWRIDRYYADRIELPGSPAARPGHGAPDRTTTALQSLEAAE